MGRLHSEDEPAPPAPSQIPEQVFNGALLTGRVRMDGTRFINCRFRDATLVYAGMAGAEMSGCSFEGTQIEFIGPARNTLNLLRAMAAPHSGLSSMVRATFAQLFGH